MGTEAKTAKPPKPSRSFTKKWLKDELEALLIRCKAAETRDEVSACTATRGALSECRTVMSDDSREDYYKRIEQELQKTRAVIQGNQASNTSFDDTNSNTPPFKNGVSPSPH